MESLNTDALRILYSFPDTLGEPGIGAAAWYYVEGLARRGHDVVAYCTSIGNKVPEQARSEQAIATTLTVGHVRIPHRALGRQRAYRYHDRRVAWALGHDRRRFEVVHVWPRATLRTASAAHELDIPVVREVPNTHTAFAYERVARETAGLGLEPVPGHSHTPDPKGLALEEREYEAVDMLALPSEYSRTTFVDYEIPDDHLALHRYGFDPERFPLPEPRPPNLNGGLRALFAGRCEPRKGLHYALKAWLESGAAERGTFTICGDFYPGYDRVLEHWLEHPSVKVTGFVPDVGALMRESDVLLLPSVEDGSALVTYEAQASGCVPLVSEAAGARCEHMESGLVHVAGDVETLTEHLRLVDGDRSLLVRLRQGTLANRHQLTWEQGVDDLEAIYAELVQRGAAR
ncbi:MAG TPA: glycosyltransferase family 4 protein [Gaiellaceae bacterium]|nr:glycosyltransferase family 4 protein [Gaiellaceae bacterium]HXV96491.1 glycosyltransferase family 4 protein [Gaiellaceae bacterium]